MSWDIGYSIKIIKYIWLLILLRGYKNPSCVLKLMMNKVGLWDCPALFSSCIISFVLLKYILVTIYYVFR